MRRTIVDELKIYEDNVRLVKSTLATYTLYLKKFISFLSVEMNNPKDIYLEQIVSLTDSTGKFIRYLPINSDIIDNYFYFLLSNNKSYNVLKDNHKSLTSFFKFLENNNNLENPMDNIKFRLKDYQTEKKFSKILTRGNILKFFNSIITHSNDLPTDALLFTILLSTGCRGSEIRNLICKDIDYKNDTFLLKGTKTKRERNVFLLTGMGYEIQKYVTNCKRKDSDYLFLRDHKVQYTRKDIDTSLKEYLTLANLPPINVHGLRHSFATLMADQETPLDIIRQLLGHESLSATKGYINPHYVRNKNINMPENKIIINYLKNKL